MREISISQPELSKKDFVEALSQVPFLTGHELSNPFFVNGFGEDYFLPLCSLA